MDNFEKHIRDNKESFDEHKVDSAKLWANIATQLDKPEPKVIPLWKRPIMRVAASVVVILGLAAIMSISIFGSTNTQELNGFATQELNDIDLHYKDLVAHQVALVQNHPKLSDEDKKEFLSFMDELDDEYGILKLEMQKNFDNGRVLEAIIINYKKRIELIENLLRQINKSKTIDDNYGYTL